MSTPAGPNDFASMSRNDWQPSVASVARNERVLCTWRCPPDSIGLWPNFEAADGDVPEQGVWSTVEFADLLASALG
eukprot:856958-Lingulodinium_polyedra.AAC.1